MPNVSLCAQENEVHYNPYVDPYNGHAYVDLGLPSGTKWATMNVGATKPEEYGLYFAWGETQGYADASTKAFSWSDYKFNPSGDGSTMSKYNATDGKTVLDLEDDAARANWGGSWKMPTVEQCQELIDNTEKRWTSRTVGSTTVDGYEFAKSGDTTFSGDTLFIPAAGYVSNGSKSIGGEVWSGSFNSISVKRCRMLDFYGNSIAVLNAPRHYGYSVRGVVG